MTLQMQEPTERRHAPPIEVQVAIIATKLDQVIPAIAAVDLKVDKLDTKVGQMDVKVDVIDGKMQRIEGVVAVVRFLGIGGLAIAAVALLKAFGGI